jgi:hypothetical protein
MVVDQWIASVDSFQYPIREENNQARNTIEQNE